MYYTILGLVTTASPTICPLVEYTISNNPSAEIIYPPTNPTILAACPAFPTPCSLIEIQPIGENTNY